MDYTFVILTMFLLFDVLALVLFSRVSLFVVLVGLFGFCVGVYGAVSSFGVSSQVTVFYCLFLLFFSGLTMLFGGLRIRLVK